VGFDRNFAQGYFSDVLTEGNRIFHVIESQGQEWLQCWDASIGDACWDARVANNSPILYAGDDGILLRANGSRDGNPQNIRDRTANNAVLVVNRNTDGDATAICSLGLRNVECHDIATGSPASGAALDGLRDNWNTGNNWAFWPASPEYHEPTNRVFLADPNGRVRVTYCHDFNTGMTCDIPSINNPSSFGQAQTYTYTTASEDCLIGLAHNQIFTSLSADMSGVCTSTGTSVDITPCVCGGEVAWPPRRSGYSALKSSKSLMLGYSAPPASSSSPTPMLRARTHGSTCWPKRSTFEASRPTCRSSRSRCE